MKEKIIINYVEVMRVLPITGRKLLFITSMGLTLPITVPLAFVLGGVQELVKEFKQIPEFWKYTMEL